MLTVHLSECHMMCILYVIIAVNGVLVLGFGVFFLSSVDVILLVIRMFIYFHRLCSLVTSICV